VKFKRFQRAPVFLALAVLTFVCGLRLLNPEILERLERMTYDLRVRAAQKHAGAAATNLAFVSMEDSSIAAVATNAFGYRFGLYWPRQVYGRAVEELAAQGAKAVAFDVLFGELRPDHPMVQLADGGLMESDEFFALQMRRAGNVVIPRTQETIPPALFATNALALGDISTEKDPDGILRRAKVFHEFKRWHPVIQKFAALPEIGGDLDRAELVPGKILIPQTGTTNIIAIPVDAQTNFALADFVGNKPGLPARAKAFTTDRIWHMGIVIAAQALNLDLDRAEVDLSHGKIILRGNSGVDRVIPVDADGYFWVNWGLHLLRVPIETVLQQDYLRLRGETNGLRDDFRGKYVFVGSAAQGNDLSDRGATPLEKDTLLVSKHWNVANSVITGQFIRRVPLPLEVAIIFLVGAVTALLTLQLRVVGASLSVALLMAGYFALAVFVFNESRWWLPVVYPLGGSMLALHTILLVHLVVFEQQDKRRVKSVFSKLVSPEVVNELLSADKLAIGGSHREITVFFADVRGFTALIDQMQEQVAAHVRSRQLDPAAADKYFEESAHEMLQIVNLYLATVAEIIKKHQGTLDKYIGDCVMAFWNAPVHNEKHAVAAVRAAIDAQRAIHELNVRREAENPAREQENRERAAADLPPRPLNVALQLGTGINSGFVTVGLMGSEEHGFNYTVFGREVNLASRLEGVSGAGRIIVSDLTYYQLLRHAPELAGTCVELFPVTVKGMKDAVRIYEVPWKSNLKPET
jgi:class 3 adenylate cyclase/CHASE2 domain-containing sensor protein